jgi:8-oxo-dGTP pyrophosphatase MutT (NUDIX family)
MSIAPTRLAATVMMVHDDPFQVLMVKRNARQPFASALVFPGGVVEEQDYSELWQKHLDGAVSFSADQRALRIAACRESWEEAGLMPSANGLGPSSDESRGGSFLETVNRLGIRLALAEFVTFAHWITPEEAAKRFDTHFFICRVRDFESARCDGLETVALEWVSPQSALESEARGERSLLFPTRENLKLLAESADCDNALSAASRRKIIPIMPRLVNGKPVIYQVG